MSTLFNAWYKILLLLMFTALPLSFAHSANYSLYKNVAYGHSEKQFFDVYAPRAGARNAPVIFMVHGGGWRIGDKASRAVVNNKMNHWVSLGFIFISVNYRLLPEAHPLEQAEDIKRALVFAQQHTHKWGGASDKFILMGHSAGAHLVSLVSVDQNAGIHPSIGTVALDSAAYDIEKIMNESSPPRLYRKAFGQQPSYWKKSSPIVSLNHKIMPFLAVCSSKRKNASCVKAKRFIEKAQTLGANAQLMPLNLSHREINVKLGHDKCYTLNVDRFIATLHPEFKSMLNLSQIQTQQDCASY